MNLKTAYSILEISADTPPEEAKKKYKKLAAKLHPDVNKSPDAEEKFKQLNEAYRVIESGVDEQQQPSWNGFRNVYDPFGNNNPFDPFKRSNRQFYGGNIEIRTTISFKESVQGVKKEIKYSRQVKCPHCQGSGDKPINNGCKICGGRGQTTVRKSGAIFIQTCPNCMGKSKTDPCKDCNSTGVLDGESSVHVSVPACVVDSNVLRLQGMGNFAGTLMGLQDQYSDVFLHIKVTPEPGLRLVGKEVHTDITIPLLDALRGCKRMVNTIEGDKEVEVSSGIRNKEEVVMSVPGCNVTHRVIVNVDYPTDINALIDVLTQEGKVK